MFGMSSDQRKTGWERAKVSTEDSSFDATEARRTCIRNTVRLISKRETSASCGPPPAVSAHGRSHIRDAELCATCHTLYTKALGPDGKVIGELPEQMPYLEWLNSDYRDKQTCQDCHMPVVREKYAN